MNYTEDQLLPISALQHMLFCPRQCALIHLEQSWAENRFTAEGQLLHYRVDSPGHTKRKGLIHTRAMYLSSYQYGIVGKADLVEFLQIEGEGSRLSGRRGYWQIKPVEYKRGKPKKNRCDKVQLCAQALCLEERMGTTIHLGEIFYGKEKKRLQVDFDDSLRSETIATIEAFHKMIFSRKTPAAIYEKKKCQSCSLQELCLPHISEKQKASFYLKRQVNSVLKEDE